jgi:hypothetical protein
MIPGTKRAQKLRQAPNQVKHHPKRKEKGQKPTINGGNAAFFSA